MRLYKEWTTHMPMLIKAIQSTDGPVMELGAGPFSTPLIHWLCAESRRKVVTYEDHPKYIQYAGYFKSRTHKIVPVKSYDEIDTESNWSVVLVDHRADRRAKDAIRLKDKAELIVLHDTQHDVYEYESLWKEFEHIHHWKFCKPWTSVVSNFRSLEDFR